MANPITAVYKVHAICRKNKAILMLLYDVLLYTRKDTPDTTPFPTQKYKIL